jgi:thiamine phosphate synthase YjbQ (UPF0047 family)
VLSTCKNSQKLELANDSLKKDIKISDLKAEKYANRINALNDSLIVLERIKQREKLKIVTITKEVEVQVEAVGSLNTKGIANYYQNRYKLPVVITQYGVALTDTIAKKNIVELVQKDGLVKELQSTQTMLSIEEKKSVVKDSIITNKSLIIVEKDKQLKTKDEIEKNLTKSVKSEKVKKNIWKITAVGILGGAAYLIAK